MGTLTNPAQRKVHFYSILILFLAIGSLVNVVLLSISYFDVRLMLLGTALLTLLVLKFFHVDGVLPIRKAGFFFLGIAFIAILLRIDLYPHLAADQDQGLYTNMVETLLHGKRLQFVDMFRTQLSDQARAFYDAGDVSMPSVPLMDPSKSAYIISFYPLHSAWMAVFRTLLGEGFHTVSLLFFSLLSIIGGGLLTKEIFNNTLVTRLAVIFLAINPVLVFFSKFPVTEMPAFCFTVNGFLFLIRSIKIESYSQQLSCQRGVNRNEYRSVQLVHEDVNETNNKAENSSAKSMQWEKWLYWLIAVLCFNSLFYIRLQFFLFIPFFVVLLSLALFNELFKKYSREIISFVLITFVGFLISLVFYHHFFTILFAGVITDYIATFLNFKLLTGLVLVFLGLIFYNRTTHGHQFLNRWSEKLLALSPWFLLLALSASVFSIVTLYKTGKMPPYTWTVSSAEDWGVVRYHVLYRLMLMLSPLGLLVLIISPFMKVQWSNLEKLLFLFLALTWCGTLCRPYIPYLYYYGRYLAGEMLPYSLILLAGILGHCWNKGNKLFFWIITPLICAYFFGFSAIQWGSLESENTTAYFNRIEKQVSPNDIVLYNMLDFQQIVPLRLTYHHSLYPLTDRNGVFLNLPKNIMMELYALSKKNGGRLLLLSNAPMPDDSLTLLDKFFFSYYLFSNGENRFVGLFHTSGFGRYLLPYDNISTNREHYLYQLNKKNINTLFLHQCQKTMNMNSSMLDISGFSSPEANGGRWTDGKLAAFHCTLPRHGKYIKNIVFNLEMEMARPAHPQRFDITVNQVVRKHFELTDDKKETLIIPVNSLLKNNLDINIYLPDAISPNLIGAGHDSRQLGIFVNSIKIDE